MQLGLLPSASASARAVIEPYCDNALRIRVTSLPWVPHGPQTMDGSAGALQNTCGGGPPNVPPPNGNDAVTNGNIFVRRARTPNKPSFDR